MDNPPAYAPAKAYATTYLYLTFIMVIYISQNWRFTRKINQIKMVIVDYVNTLSYTVTDNSIRINQGVYNSS